MYIYNIYSFIHNSCTTYRLQKKNFIWFRRRVRNKNLLLPVSIDTSILLETNKKNESIKKKKKIISKNINFLRQFRLILLIRFVSKKRIIILC